MTKPPVVKSYAPGNHRFTVRVDEANRRYTVHVPPRYDGRMPTPVVVMLHGGGGTGKAAAFETGWDTKADEAGFLAVFPDAMAADPTSPSHFVKNPQLWNDGSDRFYAGQIPPDDVKFIDAMLDALIASFTVDGRRIYFTGFSNGASMSFLVGARLSSRIAAIAPVAGACWLDPGKLERSVPMMYMTGTADPLNVIEGGVPKLATGASDKVRGKAKPPVRESIMKWVKATGCPEKPASTLAKDGIQTEIYGPGQDGAEVVSIAVEGLGHTWAGGKSLLPEFMVGKRTDKIKATDIIWDFFRRHPIP
jgi:polyhydroxybutyrate depolymerase